MADIAVYGYGDNYDLIDWSLDFVPKGDGHRDIDAVNDGVETAKVIDEVTGMQPCGDRDSKDV